MQVCGDGSFLALGSQISLPLQQVHHALEIGLRTDGQQHGHKARFEGLAERRESLFEVRIFAIHLVDQHGGGHGALFRLHPRQLRAYLNARGGIYDRHGEVAHMERSNHLTDEIGVTGGIQNIDFEAVPLNGRQTRVDGNLAANFFLIEVSDGGAILDGAAPGGGFGQEQQRFRERRLTRAAVSDECDIPHLLGHILFH
ncbi:MAG: hypothetical protein BWY63_03722 [Chloroflexi bacterium ADurb.Bin360]|nr:MAG: hypothetical protein BWY63_03722 [Chloroflexi bacterium ADurb.Bin360]